MRACLPEGGLSFGTAPKLDHVPAPSPYNNPSTLPYTTDPPAFTNLPVRSQLQIR